jgi:hypothetical protein
MPRYQVRQRSTSMKVPLENTELYSLIDRLQKCIESKYPNRKWSIDFYYECAFQWKDKIVELADRVNRLERELSQATLA